MEMKLFFFLIYYYSLNTNQPTNPIEMNKIKYENEYSAPYHNRLKWNYANRKTTTKKKSYKLLS